MTFERAVAFIMDVEGGYNNDPEDGGGETKYGITKRCLDPSVRVLTSDLNWIECGQLAVGDTLLAFDEHPERHGKLNLRRIKHSKVESLASVRLPASRIITDSQSIIASDDHQWLVRRGVHRVYRWAKTSEITKPTGRYGHRGTEVSIGRFIRPWKRDESRSAGYVAGILDGEGHTSHGYIGFSQKENACLTQAERCLSELGLQFERHGKRHDVWSVKIADSSEPWFAVSLAGRLGADRLLSNLSKQLIGKSVASTRSTPERVLSVQSAGERDLVAISTSSKTLIAEGLLSHNSFPELDIPNLTRGQAAALYLKHYWDRCKCGQLPNGIDLLVFDSAVNQGTDKAIKLLQRSADVKEDGVIGPITLNAVRELEPRFLIPELAAQRMAAYGNIQQFTRYGLGWSRRLMKVVMQCL